MKKIVILMLFVCFLLNLPNASWGKQTNAFSGFKQYSAVTYINGNILPSKLSFYSYQNQYLISGALILRELGASLTWKQSSNQLLIDIGGNKYTVFVNKRTAYIGNKRIPISSAPRVVNGKIFLPESFLERITGMKITCIKSSGKIYIKTIIKKNSYLNSVAVKPASKKKIVVIDPGHGGDVKGANYGGIKEKDLNLDVSLRLASLLKSKGIKVYLTRKTDKTLSLKQRYSFANSIKASLLVSVHHNALPEKRFYAGSETLYSPSGAVLKNISGQKLALITQNELVKRLGTINRGIISRPKLAVLRNSKMPSIIAEIGYMTNAAERNRMKSSTFRQHAAEALCVGIIKTLNQMN